MERSQELESIIRSWFASVYNGDASWLDRHLSTSASLRIVGTDAEEWLQAEQAADLLRTDLQVLGGKATLQVHEAEAYSEGTVGWGVARFTIIMDAAAQVSPRWSAVFHQEDGNWKAVQIHASVGLSNEELFG